MDRRTSPERIADVIREVNADIIGLQEVLAPQAEEIARLLYSHPSSILHRLSSLAGRGLLREVEPACYQYAPRSTELHETVRRVAEIYRERRVAVITLIASKPIENVRAFSDAFRFRRKKGD